MGYDVCVVGAGVLGAAIARELSQYELRVLWLEKAPDVAAGVTRGNTGIVHSGFDDESGSVKGRYSPHGVALVEALDRHLHFGFYKCGSLVVALNGSGEERQRDESRLAALADQGRSNGVQGLELWGQSELREREPNINPDAVSALYARESGVVIPPEFCIALAENALANGVELHLEEELLAVRRLVSGSGQSGAGYELETAKGSYRCAYFVNAAGWGAPRISEMLGVSKRGVDYELQAVKGQYLIFDRSCGRMVRHVLFPLPDKIKGKGVTVCPTYHGNLLMGPDAEFIEDSDSNSNGLPDLSTRLGNLQGIYRKGLELLPGVPRSKVICSYAGMRPRLKSLAKGPDKDPNKGLATAGTNRSEHQSMPGDFRICYGDDYCELLGIASPGLTSSLPIAGELVRKLGQYREQRGQKLQRKTDFVLERKPYINSQRDKNFVSAQELKEAVALPPDDPECLVCRCEQVKSAVILDVLQRQGGGLEGGDRDGDSGKVFAAARQNPDFLKWRSRVSMGFCQGRFCKPRLRELVNHWHNSQNGHNSQDGQSWSRAGRDTEQAVGVSGSDRQRVPPELLRRSL
ncbi:FAD-dependent oxidoreductase [Candidatus Haliotispira prima]|uniref:FAD-dependent oxidoreductase n=1 Tax=Candidatus Haliotispira prima TaxID=3034016 RepID=A0ABY8MHU5_9SPIO|nr:FAD-dependent oxidoreductase [Candidatus Haliotispira prima]